MSVATYRDRLAALPAAELLLPADRHWRRICARFDPGREPYATLVYESGDDPQAIIQIEAFEAPRPAAAPSRELGWLRLLPFPADPVLRTLPALLATCGRATVVRYHPARRCTIRAERRGRTQFAKVFAGRGAERVHGALHAVARAQRRGELEFAVAQPAGLDRRLGAVWQDGVAGAPAGRLLSGAGGTTLAMRMGRAAASLTRTRMRPRAVVDASAQVELSDRRAAELVRRVPPLGRDTAELIHRLRCAHAAAGPRRLRPIHGALYPSQWLIDGRDLTLLDFDGLGVGDPERDAGSFVAAVAAEDRARVPVDRLNAAFLAGYESVAGPLDPALIAAYCAHRYLAKALKAASSIQPDGDRQAERRIGRALECLREAGA